MYQNLAILAAFAFLYSSVSGGLARTPVNGALVFMVFGTAMGPLGLGLLDLDIDAEGLRIMAELTLALVLFTDAAGANLRELQHSYRIPLRLLPSAIRRSPDMARTLPRHIRRPRRFLRPLLAHGSPCVAMSVAVGLRLVRLKRSPHLRERVGLLERGEFGAEAGDLLPQLRACGVSEDVGHAPPQIR